MVNYYDLLQCSNNYEKTFAENILYYNKTFH